MRRRLVPVTRAGDDTGAMLIFALILITVIAIVIGSLLSFDDTSVRVTLSSRSEAADAYGADAAAQVAINQLRLGSFNNDTSSTNWPQCFGTTGTLSLNNFYPGTNGSAASSAAVSCSPDPNTGAAGGLVPITASNKPGNAILTLGTNPAEDGIHIKALNNSTPFVVHGSVVSDSNINVTNGSLQSNAAVYAHTGCTGTITSTPAPACNSGAAADPNYSFEPAYASPANAIPVYQPLPTSCPGKLMTFAPGYYDDAVGLTSLMASQGSGPCKGSVWWFKPGIYYFDFHNSSDPLLPAGADQWTVGSGQLIAGTPIDSTGAVLSAPPSPATVPGACQNPIKSTSAVGVQFIFGGDSQLQLAKSADAEICGSYQTGRPPIAVYGLTSGNEASTTANSLVATATTATQTGSTGFAPPSGGTLTSGVTSTDSKVDTWTNADKKKDQSATLTLSGFSTAQPIPAGSVLTAAALRVVYGASTAATKRQVVITPNAPGSAPVTTTVPSTAQAAGSTQTVPLLDTTASGLAASIHSYGFTGASIAYTATQPPSGTENLDAVYLDLTYTVPAFRAEDATVPGGNCLTATYTGTGNGVCAVLSTSATSSYSGAFYIQGTTYTPKAVIDLTLSNITSQVLRFGVISRSLWIKETGALTYSGPVIEVPDNSPGFGPGGTVLYLTVYLCPAASTCSTSSGTARLRVRIYLFDPSGSPSPPARQITVQSWALQR